jgi:glycerol-3-phosphate acyltransferase PlsY
VVFACNPLLGVATLVTFAIFVAFFRYVSLASMVAAVFAPFYQVLIWDADAYAVALAVMGLLLVWRHEANIRRLVAGTESKLGQKARTS